MSNSKIQMANEITMPERQKRASCDLSLRAKRGNLQGMSTEIASGLTPLEKTAEGRRCLG